jgi:hypothetical protein
MPSPPFDAPAPAADASGLAAETIATLAPKGDAEPGELPAPGRNGERDFHGERRKNDTHVSTTDPDARLYRKGPGKEARLCFMGHALMENRNGLIIGAVTTRASGHAERLAALALIEPHCRPAAAGYVGCR